MTILNDRIEIDPAHSLPEHDTAFARAYAAQMRGMAGGTPMMALVCTSPLPTRSDLVTTERTLSQPNLILPRDVGPVAWPMAGGKALAFIYDVPRGRRLMRPGGVPFAPLKADTITQNFIRPIGLALAELARLSIFHGAVRADNIYIEEGEAGFAMLGDHLAQPVAFAQPAIYETVERGLAPPLARGAGGASDDLYAFGVSILVALLGDAPLKELSDEQISHIKMERGSYVALLGERRFGPAITELLRGLLADDTKHRWTHVDFGLWLEGRRMTPKQAMAAKKASRPLRFNGQEFLQTRQLAATLAQDTKLAAAFIRNEEISRWLGHGLNDEEAVGYLQEAMVASRRQRAGSEDERIVANAIMTLDPSGPIRYRGVSVFPAGLPTCFADLVLKDTPPHLLTEIIQNDMPTRWLAGQVEKRPDLVAMAQILEKVKDPLEKTHLGFGAERALYELNPTLPCLSHVLRDQYAMTPRQLVEALDKKARDGTLIDRHIAAFLLARDRKIMPQLARAIEQAQSAGMRGLAILTLYSDLQYRLNLGALPGLAGVLLPMLDETVHRFKNRARQEKVKKDLKAAAAEGSLTLMQKLVDDPDLITRDSEEYMAARMLYRETGSEIERMASYARNKPVLAREAGEPLAAVIAVAVGFAMLCFVGVRAFF